MTRSPAISCAHCGASPSRSLRLKGRYCRTCYNAARRIKWQSARGDRSDEEISKRLEVLRAMNRRIADARHAGRRDEYAEKVAATLRLVLEIDGAPDRYARVGR